METIWWMYGWNFEQEQYCTCISLYATLRLTVFISDDDNDGSPFLVLPRLGNLLCNALYPWWGYLLTYIILWGLVLGGDIIILPNALIIVTIYWMMQVENSLLIICLSSFITSELEVWMGWWWYSSQEVCAVSFQWFILSNWNIYFKFNSIQRSLTSLLLLL